MLQVPQGDFAASSPSSVGGGSSVASSVGDEEPIQKVINLLETLISSSTPPDVRKKCDAWLTDFQKSRESSPFVLEILYAALLPEKSTGASSLRPATEPFAPSPAAIGTLQNLDQDSQLSLLSFVSQTLHNKLRHALTHPNALAPTLCPPEDLLLMARRAAEMPGLSNNQGIGKNLSLAVGQMAVLEFERGGSERAGASLDTCYRAIAEDAASLMIGHKSNKSVDAIFAEEVLRGFAKGAKSLMSSRGLRDEHVQSVLSSVAGATSVLFDIQNTRLMPLLDGALSQLSENELAGERALDALGDLSARFCNLSELVSDLIDAADSLLLQTRVPLGRILEVDPYFRTVTDKSFTSTINYLQWMGRVITESSFISVSLSRTEFAQFTDFLDVTRQTQVAVVDQSYHLLSIIKKLQKKVATFAPSGLHPRASDPTGAAAADMRTLQFNDWVNSALRVADVTWHTALRFWQASQISSEYTRAAIEQLQRLRIMGWLSENGSETVPLSHLASNSLEKAVKLRDLRKDEATRCIGPFWNDHVTWCPLDRGTFVTTSTPEELLERLGDESSEDLIEDSGYEMDALTDVWAKSPSHRVLCAGISMLEFWLSQLSTLYGAVCGVLRPGFVTVLVFDTKSPNMPLRTLLAYYLLSGNSNQSLASLTLQQIALMSPHTPPLEVYDHSQHFHVLPDVMTRIFTHSFHRRSLIVPENPDASLAEGWQADREIVLLEHALLSPPTFQCDELRGVTALLTAVAQVFEDTEKAGNLFAAQGLATEVQAASALRDQLIIWLTEGVLETFVTPIFFESLHASTRNDFNNFRAQGRRVCRASSRLLSHGDAAKAIITSLEGLPALTKNYQESPHWAHKLAEIERWKVAEALITATSTVAPVLTDTSLSINLMSSPQTNELMMSHRAVLKSTVTLLHQDLSVPRRCANPNFLIGALTVIRASLRLPESDDFYPLRLQQDHIGTVAMARLSAAVETLNEEEDVQSCVREFAAHLWEAKTDGIAALLEDAIFLIEQTCSRAVATGSKQSPNTACFVSLNSLVMVAWALGQITGTALAYATPNTFEVAEIFIRKIGDIVYAVNLEGTSGKNFNLPQFPQLQTLGGQPPAPPAAPENAWLTARAMATLVSSLAAFASGLLPWNLRPEPAVLASMGLPGRLENSWAQKMEMFGKLLRTKPWWEEGLDLSFLETPLGTVAPRYLQCLSVLAEVIPRVAAISENWDSVGDTECHQGYLQVATECSSSLADLFAIQISGPILTENVVNDVQTCTGGFGPNFKFSSPSLMAKSLCGLFQSVMISSKQGLTPFDTVRKIVSKFDQHFAILHTLMLTTLEPSPYNAKYLVIETEASLAAFLHRAFLLTLNANELKVPSETSTWALTGALLTVLQAASYLGAPRRMLGGSNKSKSDAPKCEVTMKLLQIYFEQPTIFGHRKGTSPWSDLPSQISWTAASAACRWFTTCIALRTKSTETVANITVDNVKTAFECDADAWIFVAVLALESMQASSPLANQGDLLKTESVMASILCSTDELDLRKLVRRAAELAESLWPGEIPWQWCRRVEAFIVELQRLRPHAASSAMPMQPAGKGRMRAGSLPAPPSASNEHVSTHAQVRSLAPAIRRVLKNYNIFSTSRRSSKLG